MATSDATSALVANARRGPTDVVRVLSASAPEASTRDARHAGQAAEDQRRRGAKADDEEHETPVGAEGVKGGCRDTIGRMNAAACDGPFKTERRSWRWRDMYGELLNG